MALTHSTASELGSIAPHFTLPGVDGKTYSLNSFADQRGLLIVFMCNHCPYVVAVHERLSKLASDFSARGIAVIGINSNDPAVRESDSFENMKKISEDWKLSFPYVYDESQSVAKAYDAVCTPDPYLFENVSGDFVLRYRGRLDDSWQNAGAVKHEDLRNAMESIADGQTVSPNQIASMGCGIKWKK